MKKIYTTTILIFTILFTGCIKDISPQGLTISIPASTVTESLQQQFPITQSFTFGKIHLTDPQAILKQGSNRVLTGTSIGYSSSLIPMQKGSLYLSGVPYFDARSGNIFLREPKIEKLSFNQYKLSSFIQGPMQQAILPIINEIFRKTPIYRINKSSIQSSFLKNIYVSNGELLVTFGL
jgi:hypothetical protein